MNAAVSDVHRCTKVLVEREWIRSQSKMVAYDRVGSQIGASGMWVRRFVKGYGGAGLTHIIAQNIIARYREICSSIERGNEKMRAENAAHQSNSGMREVEDTAGLLPHNDY